MIPQNRTTPIVVRTVSDEAAWDGLVGDWTELFRSSPQAATPLRFAWLRHWWRVYGPVYSAGGLRILTCWRGDKLVGVLPLYEGRLNGYSFGPRRIGFLSTGEAEFEESSPDYMNLLAAPGEEGACLSALSNRLHDMKWDYLEFLDVPEGSPLLSVGAAYGDSKWAQVEARGSCPVANLEGGFDAYLQRLSGNGRQQARRLVRQGEKSAARFEIVSGPERRDAFEDLIRLHRERWQRQGKEGAFAAARFTQFHRSLVDELEPRGEAILARLSLAGRPVAVVYGFVTANKFDFYQSGVQMGEPGALHSPGNLAHLLLMRELCARGVIRYDFLRGSSQYKERLATEKTKMFSIQVWRPTPRSIAYRSTRFLARAALRTFKRLSAPRKPQPALENPE
jgi:CelD/BcsL family acetyltransferase involved in cellulose biosynthesis